MKLQKVDGLRTKWCTAAITSMIISANTTYVHAEAIGIPYITSVSHKVAITGGNVIVTWTTKGGKMRRDIPDNELDVTCEQIQNSVYGAVDNACSIGMVIPSISTTPVYKQGEFLLAHYTTTNKKTTVREMLQASRFADAESFLNPTKNGYYADGGSGCYSLSARSVWAGYVNNRGQYYSMQSRLLPTLNSILNANCMGIMPEETWCALTQPEIKFDFGVEIIEQDGGSSKSAKTNPLTVQCTSALKYKIRDIGGGNGAISLSNGGKAKLSLDGSWGQTHQGRAGTTSHVLRAELTGSPSSTGPYSGSTILAIEYP